MSSDLPRGRIALGDLVDRKGRRRILMSGAYTAPFARALDRFVDVLLVDREVARAIHGFHSTADATLDMMILHGQAVMRGAERAAVLIELPTGTYESTSDRALHDAELLVEATGCAGVAVPIEVETIEVIRVLVDNAIPVLGLIEVGERAVATGSDDPDWLRIQTTRNVQAAVGAGAFGILAFGSDDPLLEDLTRSLRIPVLGTESAGVCDGQFLNDTEFLSMISAIKTASRTRPAPREAKPAGAGPVAATPGPGGGPIRSPSPPPAPNTDATVPRKTEPVAARTSPVPATPPIRTEPAVPRTPLPAPAARAPIVPPARKPSDPVPAPPAAATLAPAKSPSPPLRPGAAGTAPPIPPRPAPASVRPGPPAEATPPAVRTRPAVAAPGSRPPPPAIRAELGEAAGPPAGPATAPPLVGTGTVPPRAPSMPPMRTPGPIAPLPPVATLASPSPAAPSTEPTRSPMPAPRTPAPAPAARAPSPMPPPRAPINPETRPPVAEPAAKAHEVDVTLPVKMPPARTRRPASADPVDRPATATPDPIPEAATSVRAEAPEEEPTRLITPEAPPVEEVTSSRIAWTGPAKPEKQTLFGALRGRLKSTPRVIAIGIGWAAASAGLGLDLAQSGADGARDDAPPVRVERAG